MMFEYCVLIDKENYGTVVKADGPKQYRYEKDRGWVRSGILLDYQMPSGPKLGMYKDITEQEALEMIEHL
ncbi:MAG: hypothetical protein GX939_07895 [Clostridiaceae bacterium]|nr:hypothetical protein [Clostridiaceae bacterium]